MTTRSTERSQISILIVGLICVGVLVALIYTIKHSLSIRGAQQSHVHSSSAPEFIQEQGNGEEVARLTAGSTHGATMTNTESSVSNEEIDISVNFSDSESSIVSSEVEQSTENYAAQSLRLAREDPNYVSKLFEQYVSLDNVNDRRRIASRVAAIAALSESGEKTELQIVEKVLDPNNADQLRWAELLGEVGVRSYDSRQMLIDAIPLIDAGDTLKNVIQAVLPVESTPEEKLTIVAQLKPFVDNDDSGIRAAAVRGVSMWGNQDHVDILENGLQDKSNDVRHAAAAAAMMSDLRSDNVKDGLLRILFDSAEPSDTREQAYYALSNYSLTDQELGIVRRWESVQ